MSRFKCKYAKEVSMLKKTFLYLKVCLKILSTYEKLEVSKETVFFVDIVYNLYTSILTAIYSILCKRKFFYMLSTTSKDVVKIFNTINSSIRQHNKRPEMVKECTLSVE